MELSEKKTESVMLNGQQIVFEELSFRKIKVLAGILKDVLRRDDLLAGLNTEDAGAVLATFTRIAEVVPDKVIDVLRLSVANPGEATEAALGEATVSQTIDMLQVIWKLNNLKETFQKKVQPLLKGGGTEPTPST